MLKVNVDFVTKQAERAHSRKILEKCREGFQYAVVASPPPPPRRDINKHIAKDFKKMFQRNSRNAENSLKYNLNCNSLKKVGTNFSTIV
jgi:hypothetical protein